MNFLDLIQTRRSIRSYQEKAVPKDLIEQVLEAASWAPSAMDRQPWRFVVVKDSQKKDIILNQAKQSLLAFLNSEEAFSSWGKEAVARFKKRAEAEGDTLFYHAPALVFVIKTLPEADNFDLGLTTQNILLAAHALSLGTCCIGLAEPLNNSREVCDLLKLKANEQIKMVVTLGYPNESPDPHPRKSGLISWLN